MLIEKLTDAKLSHPFEHLGLQPWPEGKGLVLRAWLPGAKSVEAKALKGDHSIGMLEAQEESYLFELQMPHRHEMFNYKLVVTYDTGEPLELIDPYQFHDIAYEGLDTMRFAPQNLYKVLGAQIKEIEVDGVTVSGVRFAVYAPSATSVSLIGDFNFWDGRRLPMQRSLDGHWVLFVPGLKAGDKYKYELKSPFGDLLPHKADPVGFLAEQYPSHASVVFDHGQYEWHDQEWLDAQARTDKHEQPLSIYELHLGSWKRKQTEAGMVPLSYRELVDELIPYIKEMGYTHIEMLPISEFPFDGSWGYQPIGLFAPTSRFGDPDDFKYFVDQCHQNGIGVIVDWVPAHFPADAHGLARFDGTPLYEYEDPRRGWHQDWNSYIYDFGRDTVRQFLVASALIWLDKFHVDGLRVDAVASMLYWDYSRKEGEWVPNIHGGRENYEAISLLRWFNEEVYRQYPGAMTIAEESTAFPGVSKPTHEGGLGFGFKWNMGWMHDSLTYMKKDPLYRQHHHHEMTFAMVYHYGEHFMLALSHDEVVHGKGSLIGKMPGDEWQQAANLRAYTAFMYGHPGKKLNFMGHEIAQAREWNHNDQLEWFVLEYPKHKGQQQLVKDLNRLYCNSPSLYEGDYEHKGFAWIDHSDSQHSVFTWMRRDLAGQELMVVVSSFTPVPREEFRIGVEEPGSYELVLNTDAEMYWGGNYPVESTYEAEPEPWNDQPYSILVSLPPLSTLFLKKVD